jgi:hypothetical protein
MALKKLDDSLARKEQAILWKAFKKHNTEIASWVRKTASELSNTTWSNTLHLNAPAQLRSLLIMCHELEIPMLTLKAMLIARGEETIANMLKED